MLEFFVDWLIVWFYDDACDGIFLWSHRIECCADLSVCDRVVLLYMVDGILE